jgi:flagellar hook-associated protein 2
MATVSSTSTPVSIASTSTSATTAAAGGSVIDVSSLVSQLVTASRAGKDSQIATQTQTVTTQISAVGSLKSALSTFQSSLSAIDTPGAFSAMTANTSNATAFTATAGTSAVAGTYSVSISQLAQAQQLVSNPFTAGASAAIGTGTLQVSIGGQNFSVAVNSANNTLSGIASTINSAAGNPGVTATVINGTDGAHLVLSSTLTGAANTISVAETDGGNALSALTYSAGGTTNYTQNAAAQDAQFSISGIPHTSASNTIDDAISGVTLNLLAPTTTTTGTGTGTGTATPATLSITNDTSAISTNVSAFVDAYNTMVGSISSLNSYDQTTNTAGPLLGDALLSGIQNDIRSTLYSVVNTGSSTYNSLASVGITTNSDGTLTFNSTKFNAALSAAPGAVSSLFSSTGGVAATLNTQITQDLATGGSIDSRSKTLVKQSNALTQETTDLNSQMTALSASLTKQYAALNTLLSSLQSTSAYLSQQFAALPVVQQKG